MKRRMVFYPESGNDDTSDFLFLRIPQDVGEHWDDIISTK